MEGDFKFANEDYNQILNFYFNEKNEVSKYFFIKDLIVYSTFILSDFKFIRNYFL